nr:MAG TPA: hypothetical protein [Caudoviricetes sp.]
MLVANSKHNILFISFFLLLNVNLYRIAVDTSMIQDIERNSKISVKRTCQ